jgi:molybdenum cofactor cytidylyltransferase
MISAIILAAGQSKRMGQPKMLLPWGNVTVIEHVISVFEGAGVEDILVITGGASEQVTRVIQNIPDHNKIHVVNNEDYERSEMLTSIQCGLRILLQDVAAKDSGMKPEAAALIGLGDQPQVRTGSVRKVMEAFVETQSPIVVPSYQMRRGHPWLVAQSLWHELLALSPNQSPRDFLNAHASQIQYVNVDTPSILADLDTPEDYQLAKPDEQDA